MCIRDRVSAELDTKEVEGIAGTPVVVNNLVAQNGVAAVSYTHLDVYKRQEYGRSP